MGAQQIAFFSVTATVTPVLFLALVYQRGFFESADEAVNPLLDLWTLTGFVLGETAALVALGRGDHGPGIYALTVIPVALGALGLIGPIASPRLGRAWREAGVREGARRHERPLERLLVVLFALAIFGIPIGVSVYLAGRAMIGV